MLVHFTINGKQFEEDSSLTILQAAKKNNIHIPTLCYMFHEETGLEHKPASCRVCIVEVKGRRNLVPACATTLAEGMEIITNNKRVLEARKTVVELLLSNHPNDCLYCDKSGRCELQNLAVELGIRHSPFEGELSYENVSSNMRGLIKNPAKCVLCGRCVAVCRDVQGINAISPTNRGFKTKISEPYNCITCGQCIQVCPTGALLQMDNTLAVEHALNDPEKIVIVNTAPATRVALGDEFGFKAGEDVTGKMVTSLRELGFDKVFDTNFSADLTIMEEANELLERLKSQENLPLITSCCPGWVKFIEINYPDLLNLPSSCKSPMGMFGAIAKSYYCEKNNIDPKKVFSVALMPCVAKKREAVREELRNDDMANIDAVLTVKEFSIMLKRHGVDFAKLEDGKYDSLLGESSGAGDIFANTGGVIEAAARTAAKWLDKNTKNIDFHAVRGLSGVREATVDLGATQLRLCVISGLANARPILEEIRKGGERKYDAIEIMACPGGCVNGGGQTIRRDMKQIDVIKARQAGIYNIDKNKKLRVSCDNPEIQELYATYLEKPGSHKAHELLHTEFHDCSKPNRE